MRKLSERTDFIHGNGILGFVYYIDHVGVNGEIISRKRYENIITNESRDYLLTTALMGGSQYTEWYVGLYRDAYSPVVTDTLATLLASANECISYDTVNNARLTMVPDALSNGLWSNIGTPLEFDFNTQAETLRGGFITSTKTMGATTGLLLSTILFPDPNVMKVGETLRVKAGIQLVTG